MCTYVLPARVHTETDTCGIESVQPSIDVYGYMQCGLRVHAVRYTGTCTWGMGTEPGLCLVYACLRLFLHAFPQFYIFPPVLYFPACFIPFPHVFYIPACFIINFLNPCITSQD